MKKSHKKTKEPKRFKENNYDTVLDRIMVRALGVSKLEGIKPKWDNFSLRELLENDQKQLKGWIMRYLANRIFGVRPDVDIEEEELIAIVQWMDRSGLPPTRITQKAYEESKEK